MRWDDENLREHQRTAGQLRALKTKKMRHRLSTKGIRNPANTRLHAMTMSPIGLTSMTNLQWLSHSVMSPKDKDLIASQQELPQTSRHNEELGANFGTTKLQGHVGCNESL